MKTASGEILLNAEAARVLVQGDFAIGIAEDDSTFALDLPVKVRNADSARTLQPTEKKLERTLIVGWSDLTPLIAEEIDTHVAPNSRQ